MIKVYSEADILLYESKKWYVNTYRTHVDVGSTFFCQQNIEFRFSTYHARTSPCKM